MASSEQDTGQAINALLRTISEDARGLSSDIGRFSSDLAESFERQFNSAADAIRQNLHDASWCPDALRPSPPPPPPSLAQGYVLSLLSWTRIKSWVYDHRALTAAIFAFVGTSAFLIHRRRYIAQKRRRARRATNGAKTEVVVLVGSPFSAITKSIALDLDQRGFLVQIPVSSEEEKRAVADLRVADIRPMQLDVTSTNSTTDAIQTFSDWLINPRRHGTRRLHFASLIILDSFPSTYPKGTITTLTPESISSTLNAHVVYPVALAQAFLPVLQRSDELINAVPSGVEQPPYPPSTLLLVSSATAMSVNAPEHLAESMSASALKSFLATVRIESPSLKVTHVKLGSLAISSPDASSSALVTSQRHWSAPGSTSHVKPQQRKKGGNQDALARQELHHTLYDALVGQKFGTAFVGSGARTYALVGALAPASLIRWLSGYRPSELSSESKPTLIRRSSSHGSSSDGSGSGSGNASANGSSASGSNASGAVADAAAASAEWDKIEDQADA